MLVTIHSAVFDHGRAIPIVLEFSASHHGLPGILFVGSPRSSLSETHARVLAAFRTLKLVLPRAKVTINMLPVDIPKQGSSLDLAVALGLLMVHGVIAYQENLAVVGELGLAGEVRSFDGLPLLIESLLGNEQVITSNHDTKNLLLVSQPKKVFPCSHLQEIITHFNKQTPIVSLTQQIPSDFWWREFFSTPKIEAKISESLAQVLALALVGGHHLLVYGSPGVGKSHMKSYLPALLPPLSDNEMRAIMLRRSLTGRPSYSRVLSPHTSATIAGLLGGGTPFKPGALEEADKGILFLDELPEFQPEVLESLRQPLEEEGISLIRSGRSYFVPCSCTVIATANPCPCGYFGEKKCVCSFVRVQQYLHRLSGPLLDRFAFQYRMLPHESKKVSLIDLAQQIAQAKALQRERSLRLGTSLLARHYTQEELITLDSWPQKNEKSLSLRRQMQLGRVARTVADIRLSEKMNSHDWEVASSLVLQNWG